MKKISVKTTALDDEEELFEVWNQVITARRPPDTTGNSTTMSDFKRVEYFYDVWGNSKKKKMYDYPVLNGNLDTLRVMLKTYKSHITDKMFEYGLIK